MTRKRMTHASLFSGIGGFDLAAQWVGFENLFNCEISRFCSLILNYYFPNAIQYGDIKTTDFTPWRGKIDILTGGFPCQPFSLAGKRQGTEDDRYLWPEMLRAISEIRPAWVIGENVGGIVSMVQPGCEVEVAGQATLFGEDYYTTQERQEFIIERICRDIEHLGYSIQPILIPACSVGAPHRRDRVWFVAHTLRERLSTPPIYDRATPQKQVSAECKMPTLETVIANDFRSESNKHGVVDGIPEGLDECSIKGYGNAIVPQVALQIMEAIKEFEQND